MEFLNQIGCLIVYGPTALNGAKLTFHSDNTYVQDGQLPKTTFGFIACITTMVSQISQLALIILQLNCSGVFWQVHFILSGGAEFNASGIGSTTNVRYLEAHNFYKKLLIEGLANLNFHQNFVDLINQWNDMVFPQAVLKIIPDLQTPSANEGSTSNPKNLDVGEALRLLSLGNDNTRSDSEPEMLGLLDTNHDGLLNNEFKSYDDFNNYFDNSTQVHPHSIPPLALMPPTSANPTPWVHKATSILATSARALSTTISTTTSTSTILQSPANNQPDPLPAPKKSTHTTNHRIVTVQEGQPSTDVPSEVCSR